MFRKLMLLCAVLGAAFLVSSPPAAGFSARVGHARVVTVGRYLKANQFVLPYSHKGGYGGLYVASRGGRKGMRRLAHLRGFAKGPNTLAIMRRRTAIRRKAWRFHRRIDRLTPFGEWSVPPEVVRCESGMSYAPSHGITGYGAYALISWADYGGYAYASSPSQALPWQQHIVAHRMYAERGLGPWEASRHCWG